MKASHWGELLGVIMRGFALSLALAGFNVITWDFDGHGRDPYPLQSMTHRGGLVNDAEQALREAARLGAEPFSQRCQAFNACSLITYNPDLIIFNIALTTARCPSPFN
jgi:alpha-beta hydrolase superfamily lysophospholipase